MASRTRSLAVLVVSGLLSTVVESEGLPRGFKGSSNPHVEKWAYLLTTAVWVSPTIYVCWENPSSGNVLERSWVEDAITQSWQRESGLKFKGWGTCATTVEGIRIQIDDSGPHVKALGRGLDNLSNGMVLNFSFHAWSPECRASEAQRTLCIKSIAVHEFGHAIGLAHEQNRPDAPGECASLAQGPNGDVPLTPYDPDSVMNYCNPVYNNDGKLSALDVAAVREVYPQMP